jgi:hypothetical protein
MDSPPVALLSLFNLLAVADSAAFFFLLKQQQTIMADFPCSAV